MANTVIQHKRNSTGGVVPSSLAAGELAVNLVDRKLFTSNGTTVFELGLAAGGSNTQIEFNDSGQSNGSANFTFNKTTSTVGVANTISVGNATVNAVVNATSLRLANSTSNVTISVPNTTQYANGSYYLNANGSWTYSVSNYVVRQTFTANSTVNTTFTVTNGYVANNIDVFLNGVKLVNGTDVTVTSGNTIVLAVAAANGDIVDVVGQTVTVGGGGGGTPGGSNTWIQYNSSGTFGANSLFTFDEAASRLHIGNTTANATANVTAFRLANSTSNISLTIPTTTQANGSHYLNGNGSWVVVTGGGGGGNTVFARQNWTANATVNTTFTVTAGYTIGQLDVYQNGVKLLVGSDVDASDGTTIILTTPAVNGDIVEIVGFANVNVISAGGSDTHVQYNNGGVLGGAASFAYDDAANTLYLGTTGVLSIGNSTANATLSTTQLKLANSTNSITIPIPNTTQANGSHFLNGNGSWTTAGGGGGTPGGSNTYVQFNSSGAFGGEAGFAWNTSTKDLSVGNNTISAILGSNGVGLMDITNTKYYMALDPATSPTFFVSGESGGSNGAVLTAELASNKPLAMAGNGNNNFEVTIKNYNTGNNVSAEFVATADTGNATVDYVAFGINGNNYNQAAFNISGSKAGYVFVSNGALTVGTLAANDIIFHAGGATVNNEVARFKSTGGMDMVTSDIPDTPAVGRATVYVANVAGRVMPSAIGNSGISYQFQPHLGRNRFVQMNVIDNTAAPVGIGIGFSNTGARTARSMGTGNTFLSHRRTGHVTAATANVTSQSRGTRATHFLGNAAGIGGFHYIARAGIAAFQTTASVFVGMHTGTAAIGNIELTAIRTAVGFGVNPGTNNWVVFSANTTAAATIDLGSGFPCNTNNTDMYEFMMFAKPNSATVTYRVVNIRTGNSVSGTCNTSCMPAVNSLMAPKFYLNNGSNATAAGLDICSLYIESDNSG